MATGTCRTVGRPAGGLGRCFRSVGDLRHDADVLGQDVGFLQRPQGMRVATADLILG